MSRLTQHEKRTVDVYNENAKVWAENHSDPDFWTQQIEYFSELLPNGRILEIGSGDGRDAHLLIEKGYEYIGTDASRGLLDVARRNNPGAIFEEINLYDLAANWQEYFDGFWASAVLLHILKDRIDEALQSIYATIRQGAIGFIAIKEGDGEQTEPDGRRFSYWRTDEFKQLLDTNGLKVQKHSYIPMSVRTKWLCYFVEKV